MTWDKLQTKIADRYCGTVVVLDDEIYRSTHEAKGKKSILHFDERFHRAKQAFESKGAFCDMLWVQSQFDDNAKLRGIKRVIERSDAIVVDWYLGSGKDAKKDPVNALKILRFLRKCPGIRFAVVHSKENPNTINEKLRAEFKGSFKQHQTSPGSATETDDDAVVEEGAASTGAVPNNGPSVFQIGDNTYVCVLQKDKGHDSAEELPELFHAQLRVAFSDHLHWVGLEFAAQVKEMLPSFIRHLPSGMDVALIFQALFQDENDLADDLAECFCLELREMFRVSPMDSASDQMLLKRLMIGFKEVLKSAAPAGLPGPWVDRLKNVKLPAELKEWAKQQKILENTERRKNITKVIALSVPSETATAERSHRRYASLREHQHCVSGRALDLYPGVVLTKKLKRKAGIHREWMLCVTPSCDCARGGKRHHLFVVGQAMPEPGKTAERGVSTSLCLVDEDFEIRWLAKKFKTIECGPEGPAGWKLVTRLREPFVQRVVQQVWGQQSRVGVNTSEFIRETRGDKE
jgi:hypothetical protein